MDLAVLRSPRREVALIFDAGQGVAASLNLDPPAPKPTYVEGSKKLSITDGVTFINDPNNNKIASDSVFAAFVTWDDNSPSDSTPEFAPSILDDLERFVKEFKEARIERGFTQSDVSKIIASVNPNVSQTTISRFENLALNFPTFLRLKPYFELFKDKLVEEVEKNDTANPADAFIHLSLKDVAHLPAPRRKRFKRTGISARMTQTMEKCFLANPRPSHEEMDVIVEHCQLEARVVRVWFCNRRAKQKVYEEELRAGIPRK